MKSLRQGAAAAGFAAVLLLGGCAHHNQMATTTPDIGVITPDAAAQAGIIPGPAKVDSSGNVYTSSAAPGSGAALNGGTNTNVNIVPAKSKSTVIVTETPAVIETPIVAETPAPGKTAGGEAPEPTPQNPPTPAPTRPRSRTR